MYTAAACSAALRHPRRMRAITRAHHRRLLRRCSTCRSCTAAAGCAAADDPPQPVHRAEHARRTRSSSAAPTASAGRCAGTTTSSASSACSRTGSRARSSTISTTALRRPRGRLRAVRLGPDAASCRAPATPTAGSPRPINIRATSSAPSASGSRCGSSCPTRQRASACSPSWTTTGPRSTTPAASRAPRNNHLTNVGQWLKDQKVVDNDNRVLVRTRVRVPRGVPDQHRRLAAREVPERRTDHRRAPRARREPPPDLLAAPGGGRRYSQRSARCSAACWRCVGLVAVHTHVCRRAPRPPRRLPGTHALRSQRRVLGDRARHRGHARRRPVPGLAHRPAAAGACT